MRMSMSVAAVSAAVLALSACGGGGGVETDESAGSVGEAEAAQVPEGYGVVVEFLKDQAAAAGAVVDYDTDADAGDDVELQGLLEEVEETNEQWGGDDWPDVGTDASNGVEVAQVASDLEDESGWLAHVMLDPAETLESDDLERAREAVEAAEDELGRLDALERL